MPLQCTPHPLFINFKAVVTALVWGHYIIMATNGTLNAKQINGGTREIISKTSQLTQVLRTFATLYTKKLPSCDGMTVEGFMSAMGVERFTTTNKSGKVTKKGYTPGTIRQGWNDSMQTKEGKMCVFKNVQAKYKDDKDEDGTVYRVFTHEEAEKIDGKCVSRFMLSKIADDKWTVAIILRGLKQGRDFKKYNDRSVESEMAWEEMDNLCIIRVVEDENGKQSREIVDIEKDEVYF